MNRGQHPASPGDDAEESAPSTTDPFHGLEAIDVIDGELVPRASRSEV